MLTIHDSPGENLIKTSASGKLEQSDYDRLIPVLEQKLKKFNKLRLYFEMEDFEGWSPSAFFSDVKFDVQHANDFEKVAMVGDEKWHKWMTDAMKPFTTAEVKYFNQSQKQEALNWIVI